MSEQTPGLPDRLPYRLLTGTDDRAFCEKVSAALLDGYELHGGPSISVSVGKVVCAQAVVLRPDASSSSVPSSGSGQPL
ncbi:MAG TPA: DUF1737 domain-containing protein [Actinomycetales bacterium]|jgi:hypothetical protein